MKPFIKLFVNFLLLILNLTAFSQQPIISGYVRSHKDSVVLSGVTVKLLTKDSLEIKSTLTDKNGFFSLDKSTLPYYMLKSTLLGFKVEYTALPNEKLNSSINIFLKNQEIEINEVEISASLPLTLKGDTMEYDAKRFVTREFADADEVVAQIPGVMIDEEGNVQAHGENVTRIIVDGKEFFSSDPRVALKNLPADIIDKVQLIDEKSTHAQFSGFDDGKRNKVINIVTKPDKRKGYFGKSNAGKGNSDKFGFDASLNRFDKDKKYAINLMANNINETNFSEQGRGGTRRGNNNTERGLSDTYAAALNFTNTYLKKKLDLNADYNFRSVGTETNSISKTQYLNASRANQLRNQNQFSDLLNGEHKFNGRIKWDIDSIQKLEFSPNFSSTQSDRLFNTFFHTFRDSTTTLNKSNRESNSNNSNVNYSGSLSYMIRLNKKGRNISVSASGNKSSNNTDALNLAVTEYYKNAVVNRIDTNNNTSLTNGYGSGINTRVSLSETINNHNRIQFNYNFRNTANYSNRETFEFLAETGQLGELKERLSNEFRNDYNYHNGGISYTFSKQELFRLQFGLQYQHGIRNNDRIIPYKIKTVADFNSILPDFAAKFNLSKIKTLEINYNTQTNTPSINQLQDFINNQNELRITNGNPNLDQEYSHTLRVQYKDVNKKSGRSLTTNASFILINDKIINNILMTDTSLMLFEDIRLGAGGQYIVPMNADGAYSVRITNSYGVPINKLGINFNFNTNLSMNNDLSRINEASLTNKSYAFSQSIGINSKFSKKYIFGVTYNIDGRRTSNTIINQTNYNVLNQRLNSSITLEPYKYFSFRTNFIFINNGGILGSPDIETKIWNASLGYKIFKKHNGEISIKGFDLLNNAQNINRNVNENNISEISSNTLARYFLLSFTYHVRAFGKTSLFK